MPGVTPIRTTTEWKNIDGPTGTLIITVYSTEYLNNFSVEFKALDGCEHNSEEGYNISTKDGIVTVSKENSHLLANNTETFKIKVISTDNELPLASVENLNVNYEVMPLHNTNMGALLDMHSASETEKTVIFHADGAGEAEQIPEIDKVNIIGDTSNNNTNPQSFTKPIGE